MKKLILLAGLPGVGKSTISKKISQKTGAKILDIDDFKRVDVDPSLVTSQIDPPDVRWKYYQKALEHVFQLFETSDIANIIVDEVFHLKELRDKIDSLCFDKGIDVLWIEVTCPYELIERRLRAQTREGHILSTDEALNMNVLFEKIFEKFSIDCNNHIILENVGDVEMSVENIVRRIGC